MPQPKHDKYDETIADLAAEHPRAADVWREFEKLAADNNWHDIPGERTVKRRVDEFQKLPKDARDDQARFRWPESMERSILPWEASRAALDLLRYRDEKPGMGRPTNRHARWFWRVMLAAPDLAIATAHDFAADLASAEYASLATPQANVNIAHIEWRLAYRPWQGGDAETAYLLAAARSVDPIPSGITTSVIEPGGEDAVRAALEARLGSAVGREFFDDIKNRTWRTPDEESSHG